MIQINNAIQFAMRNKEALSFLETANCYYCLRTVCVKDIVEYTDQGQTAICPNCHVDAVLPDSTITKEQLKEIHDYWFD